MVVVLAMVVVVVPWFLACGLAYCLAILKLWPGHTIVGNAIVKKEAKSSTVVPDKHIGDAIVHKAKSFTVFRAHIH